MPKKLWFPALVYAVAIVPMVLMSYWAAEAAFTLYENRPYSMYPAKLGTYFSTNLRLSWVA